MPLTRHQRAMTQAYDDVSSVTSLSPDTRKIYGGLCHQFPVLLRTCGLCQTLAFSADKAAKPETDRGRAHQQLLNHVRNILVGQQLLAGNQSVLDGVRGMEMTQYVRATQVLLDYWIYYKRFAVSILKVESGQDAKEGQ